MFKALYFGTIKPLFAGFQDADRREMQNLFLQRKVANLVSDPAVWRAELGIPIAQIYNTERILHDEAARDVDADASLTGILNRRAESLRSVPWYRQPDVKLIRSGAVPQKTGVGEITEHELQRYLREKAQVPAVAVSYLAAARVPTDALDCVGVDFLSNRPVCAPRTMSKNDARVEASRRRPFYAAIVK